MTEQLIKQINSECPYNQGVFKEPYGIPTHIKEYVIYNRYSTGGFHGGYYGADSNPTPYTEAIPKDRFKVLDIMLGILYPNITYLQYRQINDLIHNNTETEHDYYGNSADWVCEYIVLSELEHLINKWKGQRL